jgi:3-methyl-2-oxobutanoate hydroxymethyltransferase
MKKERRKIVAVVAYDYQIAKIADRAGVDIVSVGDSVGVNLWGHANELEVTLDEMVLVCQAVRRGVSSALVSCDIPLAATQNANAGVAVSAAARLVSEGGADMVKLDGAADWPEGVHAIASAGIPVWAQFGLTPHTDLRGGGTPNAPSDFAAERAGELMRAADLLDQSGASLLDFTHSGPIAGPRVVDTVGIPVLGGLGGGPWLDGRIRSVFAAIGYAASAVDDESDRYANVATTTFNAIRSLTDDVRAGRQIRGR